MVLALLCRLRISLILPAWGYGNDSIKSGPFDIR